jgi:hypothetical protein
MEAARTSEMLVDFYQTTRRYNPEHSHLRTHRHENLKSYFQLFFASLSLLHLRFDSIMLSKGNIINSKIWENSRGRAPNLGRCDIFMKEVQPLRHKHDELKIKERALFFTGELIIPAISVAGKS